MAAAIPAATNNPKLPTPNRTSFLSLPRELRDMIYHQALHSRSSADLARLRLHHMRTAYYPLTILLLNHQIKEEFISVAAKHIGTFVLDVEECGLLEGGTRKLQDFYFPFDKMTVQGSISRSGILEFDPLWFKYVPHIQISATIFRGTVNDGNRHLLKYDRLRVVKLLMDRYKAGLLERVNELEVEIVMNFVVEREWVWKMLEPLKTLPIIKSICVRRLGPEVWWFKEESGHAPIDVDNIDSDVVS